MRTAPRPRSGSGIRNPQPSRRSTQISSAGHRRPQFDEVLDHEPVSPDGPDPVAVGDLEVDGAFAAVKDAHPEVVVVETDVLTVAGPVERQINQRRRVGCQNSITPLTSGFL